MHQTLGFIVVAARGVRRDVPELHRQSPPRLRQKRRKRRDHVLSGSVTVGNLPGAPSEGGLAEPNRVWMLGRKPRRIDILTGISGASFARASRGRLFVTVAGKIIPVIGRKALLENKRASARPKDLADVALLMSTRKP